MQFSSWTKSGCLKSLSNPCLTVFKTIFRKRFYHMDVIRSKKVQFWVNYVYKRFNFKLDIACCIKAEMSDLRLFRSTVQM